MIGFHPLVIAPRQTPSHLQLLETTDEYLPGRISWRYYGLELPSALLQSLYRDNARRILNWKPVNGELPIGLNLVDLRC